MKFNNRYFFYLLSLICISTLHACTNIKSGEEVLEIGNELYSKQFTFYSTKPGAISVSYFDKINNFDPINVSESSYFEFVLNNKLTTASDELWQFQSHTTRSMGNGGEEHVLVFRGEKGHVNGLEVKIIQQVFPNSTLVREKLELKALGDATLTLNKLDNQLHFQFPKYALKTTGSTPSSTEIRIASWELKPISFKAINPERNQNHMYYPDIRVKEVKDELHVKGPINILHTSKLSWITAYEHASQDNLKGMLNESKLTESGKIIDAMQGTKGIFNFPVTDEDFRFLEIRQEKDDKQIVISNAMVRGGYLNGEIIDKDHGFSTVWNASAFHEGNDLEMSKSIIRNYLFNEICEKPASRKPEFYYNTWGMQRADRNKPLRGILSYERIFAEIDRAVELGVDIFVLDDGWEQNQGDWTPNKERLTDGLGPIKKKLDEHGIKMGIWLSPMGIDTTAERYRHHPEWVIKDSEGNPILAQWGHPAFDFVGGFFDVFIEDCKKLIDDGALFFKWDAINTFYSSLPNLDHGTDAYSAEEIRARYEYLLPIYVTRAMEILTDYEPELIIEMDVTEARRVMIGLAPLSQGKIFHMNNGASWYNDYTEFRTNSMRTIPNVYNGIIPLELFTYANYPHNLKNKLHYNVNTSLIAGHGFWGDLSLTTSEGREIVGKKVRKSKKVLPYLTDVKTNIIGKVGDSPEIYTQINVEEAAGQVIAFSAEPVEYMHKVKLNPDKLLAVLNHPYKFLEGTLELQLDLNEKVSTCEAFIIPNEADVSITASTSALDEVAWNDNELVYNVLTPGVQKIRWANKYGMPKLTSQGDISFSVEERGDDYQVIVNVNAPRTRVVLKGN